ncbi:translation initiation factor IF-2-like [Cervus elaphus]|uniref:translation initiation factor IF-2-like n=1 Tax=Cervus elaphus TaxID=9860 RepID=UPI001CC30861|nr:translation initiation factor IF-2-like [Cervus elaphus]
MAPGTTRRAGAHSPPAREPGEGRDANEAGRVVAPAHLEDRAGGPRRAVPLHRIPSHPSAVPALTSGREGAGCERCWGAASRLPAGLSGGQRQRGRPPGGCSWLSSSRAPSRDAANAPAPQPSSPPPPRPRTEPPPAPPREQPGQRQPAPPSARPRGRRAARRSAPRCQPAVTQAAGPGNFLPRRPPRARAGRPGQPPAAEDFLQGAQEDLPPLAGGAPPASGTPTWRPVPEEWTGATTFPIPNPRLPRAGGRATVAAPPRETSLSFEDKRSPHFLLRRMNGNMALMMKTGFLKFIQELQETRLLPLITQSDCGRTDKRDCGTWSQRRLCLPCSQQCPVWWEL